MDLPSAHGKYATGPEPRLAVCCQEPEHTDGAVAQGELSDGADDEALGRMLRGVRNSASIMPDCGHPDRKVCTRGRDVGDGDQLVVCGKKVRYAALADLSEVLMRLSSCSSQKDNGIGMLLPLPNVDATIIAHNHDQNHLHQAERGRLDAPCRFW